MTKHILEIEKEGAGINDLAIEIAGFAGAWLAGHIMTSDMKYKDFMAENGIK